MSMNLEQLWQKQKQKITEAASPYLEPGDTPKFLFLAQTRVPYRWMPLPFSALYGAKKRCVIVTDRHLYLLNMPLASPTKVSGLVDKHPLSDTVLTKSSLGSLKVQDLRVWPVTSKLHRREVEGAVQFVSELFQNIRQDNENTLS